MTKPFILAALALLPALLGLGFLVLGTGRNRELLQTRIRGLSRLETVLPNRQAGTSLQKSNPERTVWNRLADAIPEALTGASKELPPWRLALLGTGCGVFVGTLTFLLFSPSWVYLVPVSLLAGLATPPCLILRWRAKRKAAILDAFPDAIDLIVRAVRAGLPLSEAFNSLASEIPGPLADEFRLINGEASIGIRLEEALETAARRIDLADFRFFCASIALQRETGGNLTETLQNLSQIIRRRRELKLKARAVTAEARTSSLVIGALPFLAAGALAVINPEYIAKLFSDPRGAYVLGAACASMAAGVFTMQMMIKKSVT